MPNFSDYYYRTTQRRNAIINGNFNIWQRGTTFNPIVSGYTADRWVFGETLGTGVCAVNQSAAKPNVNCGTPLKITATTGQASVTGSEYVHVYQKIEGYEFVRLYKKDCTFSFWVYSSVAGTYSCFFRSGTNDYSYVQEFTIHQTGTWEYKTISVTFDDENGTYDFTTGAGINVGFAPSLGTTYATSTLGQWVAGNYIGSTNQTNFAATTNNVFLISQLQLEVGRVATPFEHLSPHLERELCYRYYEVTNFTHLHSTGISTGTGVGYAYVEHTTKRATPTSIGISSPQLWSPQNGWRTPTSTSSSSINNFRILFVFNDTGVSNYVAGNALLMIVNCAIDAEL